jgi:AraC-like DNA-binding protein
MPLTSRINLAVRSYGIDPGTDRHDFAQLVLPLSGSLDMDIGGRGGSVSPGRAAFVDFGAWHSQTSASPNRSLILDLDAASLGPEIGEKLVRHPFAALTPAAGKLVDYMGLLMDGSAAPTEAIRLWVPLLLDALVLDAPRPRSRLAALMASIEAEPGLPWTTVTMAERAGLSVSRLHALFRSELDTTPRAWLAEARLHRVSEWLRHSDHSIAELAYRGGYADQSALTRAMRKATGLTPAAYRRQNRETGPKPQ